MCERVGDRALIVDGGDSLSYAQVDEESARVYRYLAEHGIEHETFAHIFMPRKTHFISCMPSSYTATGRVTGLLAGAAEVFAYRSSRYARWAILVGISMVKNIV